MKSIRMHVLSSLYAKRLGSVRIIHMYMQYSTFGENIVVHIEEHTFKADFLGSIEHSVA